MASSSPRRTQDGFWTLCRRTLDVGTDSFDRNVPAFGGRTHMCKCKLNNTVDARKKSSLFSLMLILLLGCSTGTLISDVRADVSAEDCGEQVELLKFSLEYTPYDQFKTCPIFKLEAMKSPQSDKPQTHRVSDIAALYFADSSTIVLGQHVDPLSIEGKSYIVHEIIHHLQSENGCMIDPSCLILAEPEAYLLQAAYLEKNGKQQEANFFRILSSLLYSSDNPY